MEGINKWLNGEAVIITHTAMEMEDIIHTLIDNKIATADEIITKDYIYLGSLPTIEIHYKEIRDRYTLKEISHGTLLYETRRV